MCAHAGVPIVAWAIDSVTLTSEEQAQGVAGLKEEFFAPVVVLLRIPGDPSAAQSPAAPSTTLMQHCEDFLKRIPAFSKQYIWGNLVCSIYMPETIKTALPQAVERCLDDLEYGAVVVNSAPLVAYINPLGVWGGHMTPQSSQENVGSGVGKLHNFAQIDGVEKQVFEFPWGATIELGSNPPKIPAALVKPLAGLTADGFRGLWSALTP